jgi:hypothetical protein
VGIDQRLRVDFEVAGGIGVDVCGRDCAFDPILGAEQEPTALVGVRASGVGADGFENQGSEFERHPPSIVIPAKAGTPLSPK